MYEQNPQKITQANYNGVMDTSGIAGVGKGERCER